MWDPESRSFPTVDAITAESTSLQINTSQTHSLNADGLVSLAKVRLAVLRFHRV